MLCWSRTYQCPRLISNRILHRAVLRTLCLTPDHAAGIGIVGSRGGRCPDGKGVMTIGVLGVGDTPNKRAGKIVSFSRVARSRSS